MREMADMYFFPADEIEGHLARTEDDLPEEGSLLYREYIACRNLQDVFNAAEPVGHKRQDIKTYQLRNATYVKKLAFKVPHEVRINWEEVALMPMLRDIPIGEMDG